MAERRGQSLKLVASEASLPPEMASEGSGLGAANDISRLLAEERARQGVDAREVASSLCIRLSYIQAIEDGRFADLPGPTYAVGFVRSYANYLGFDDEAVVRLFKAQVGDADSKPALIYPTPLPEGRFPGRRVIVVSLILATFVYGGWYYLSVDESELARGVPEVPARIVLAVPDSPGATGVLLPVDVRDVSQAAGVPVDAPGPALDPMPDPEAAARESAASAPGGGEAIAAPTVVELSPLVAETVASISSTAAPTPPSIDAPDGDGSAVEESAAADRGAIPSAPSSVVSIPPVAGDVAPEEPVMRVSPDQAAAATPPPPPESSAASRDFDTASLDPRTPRVYGTENGDSRIVLRAREDSWVQVRDRSNAVILTRILRRGDSYNVPDLPGLTLLTGNAGGLALTVDGVAIAPLGELGEVLRGIALEPDRLLARPLAAVPIRED